MGAEKSVTLTVLSSKDVELIVRALRVAAERTKRDVAHVPIRVADQVVKQAQDTVRWADRFEQAVSVTLAEGPLARLIAQATGGNGDGEDR
jgi:hypothetical protein